MDTTLQITLRDVYGQTKAYPVCEQAKRLARMVGTKTLTLDTLVAAREMGFELVYVDRFGSREVWEPEAFKLRLAA